MNFKIIHSVLFCLLTTTAMHSATAQEKLHPDTLQCPIVGFHAALAGPLTSFSSATAPDGSTVPNATMGDLYKAPWLDFGMDFAFKWRNGLFLNLEGSLIIGNNNLKNRLQRMPDVYSSGKMIIGVNGTDATVTSYNRMLSAKLGVGKIFILSDRNPNSGPFVRLDAGFMQNQTVFMLNQHVDAPQVNGDYAYLYDHQRRGFLLSQAVGYWFMGNRSAILNFNVSFEITEVWSASTRDYIIDDLIPMRGADNNNYFDLLYGIKLIWMFPITGKPAYDYYYY